VGAPNGAVLVTIIEVVLKHIEAEKRFIRETIEDAARLLVQIIKASADAAKSLTEQVVKLLDGVKDMIIELIAKLSALPPEALKQVNGALNETLGNVLSATNQLITTTADVLRYSPIGR
jgi:ABC-type transporter Mla subunit MlaD